MEYEVKGDALIITTNPWTGKEMSEPFIIKKWEFRGGSPSTRYNDFFNNTYLPIKQELSDLKKIDSGNRKSYYNTKTHVRQADKLISKMGKISEATRQAES